jgi:hypothetical protein
MTTTATGPPPIPPAPITPARRRLLLIAGPLLILSVVFAGLIIAQDQLPGTREFTFATEAPRASGLTVETGRTGIELEFRSGPADRLRVFASGDYSGQQPSVTVAADGSRIDADCPSGESFDCDIQIEIEVPAGTALTANNRAGRISVDGLSGALDLTARNGDIEITGGGGQVNADTTNGRVLIEHSNAPRVTASTRNGDILLGLIEPQSVEASTVNGDILVDLGPCHPYAVDIDTTADSTVSVPMDASSPRKIRARTRDSVIIECG